jgi:hypothetical protein
MPHAGHTVADHDRIQGWLCQQILSMLRKKSVSGYGHHAISAMRAQGLRRATHGAST